MEVSSRWQTQNLFQPAVLKNAALQGLPFFFFSVIKGSERSHLDESIIEGR